jgi:hypothetical protein
MAPGQQRMNPLLEPNLEHLSAPLISLHDGQITSTEENRQPHHVHDSVQLRCYIVPLLSRYRALPRNWKVQAYRLDRGF